MNPRLDVSMSPDEIDSLLSSAKNAVLTTLGRDGYPHSVAMWFIVLDGAVRMWTYGKSQKARNARRDPRCAFLVEEGEQYDELRGVLVRGRLQVIEDFDEVASIGRLLYEKYTLPFMGVPYEEGPRTEVERQARKRIALRLPLDRVASWDHTKL